MVVFAPGIGNVAARKTHLTRVGLLGRKSLPLWPAQIQHWYRFIDQPSFQQYNWSAEKKSKLQALVEKLHAHWPIDREYMAPPHRGRLAGLDPALLGTPPPDLEVGYVPIVTRQSAR